MNIDYALRAAQNITNLSPFEEGALISNPDFRDRVTRHFNTLYGEGAALEIVVNGSDLSVWWVIPRESTKHFTQEDLHQSEIQSKIITTSPAVAILLDLQKNKISLEDIKWREFEEIVAELLEDAGYKVLLKGGSKDGGADVIAELDDKFFGKITSVWQAKRSKNRIALSCVKELADTRHQFNVNKGVIVTTSYLTRGALERIEKDHLFLHKCERPKLLEWISNYKKIHHIPGGRT